MAATQTGSAIPQSGYAIEVSTSGTAWTAICGESTAVAVSGGDQPVGQLFTACGTGAIVTRSNKQNPYEIVCTSVYTETASTEAFDFVRDRYTSGTPTLYVRWSPAGTAVGGKLYNTSVNGGTVAAVPILRCTPPGGDAQSSDPQVFEFAVISPLLYETTVT